MRRWAIALAAAAGGCVELPKTGQMELAVRSLADLHAWDTGAEGKGQASYDTVVSFGPDILPFLVEHLTNETPTLIYEPDFGIRVTVSDVCLRILLRWTGLRWQEFSDDGLFVSTQLPNPIFCIRWRDRDSRSRVQSRFRKILNIFPD